MTTHTLLQQALDALIYHRDQTRPIERSDSAITALREALAASPAAPASQWMPIEIAPKDSLYEDGENRYGRRILVWGNGYDEPMRARWWFRIDSNRQNFISDAGFAVFPTHWMPLPAAPDHLRDTTEKVAPAAPVVREPLRDDAFHAWVEETSADHPNLLERQEFRDAMYNAWINGYNTRVDEQAHGITGGTPP